MAETLSDVEIFDIIQKNQGKHVETAVVRDLYNKWSTSYDKDTQELELYGPNKAADLINDLYADKNISILDCGAGTGLVGSQLHSHGFRDIVALDISPKILETAEQKGVYSKLVCAEVGEERLPFEDGAFDVVVCSGCIVPFHISPDSFPEWVRIAKTGGHIVVVLRRCYVELVKNEEGYYSQSLAESFEGNIRNLQNSGKWQVVSKEIFPGYLVEKGQRNDGIALVCRKL